MPPRWTWPIFVFALLIGLGILLTDHDVPIDEHRVRDEDTIIITVTGGRNWFWTRIVMLEETEQDVRIRVRSFEWPLPTTAIGVPYELVVDLETPIGDRAVIDASLGQEVPRVNR